MTLIVSKGVTEICYSVIFKKLDNVSLNNL